MESVDGIGADRKLFANRTMTHQQKALTVEHPNERELKNVARWIYCWNLWTELVRQQLELFHSKSDGESQITKISFANYDSTSIGCDTKESLLTELQTHVVTNPVQTLSKVKTIRRIKEIGIKIDVWEKVRSEGVNYLACLQLRSCEYKENNNEQIISNKQFKTIESLKQKFLEKIMIACKNIDYFYKQMEDAIFVFKNHRCNSLFVNPIVAKAVEKCNNRINQTIVIPGVVFDTAVNSANLASVHFPWSQDSTVASNSQSQRTSSKKSCKSKGSSSFVPDVPDFMESLFAGRKPPKSRYNRHLDGATNENSDFSHLAKPPDRFTTKERIRHYIEIIAQGAEWYFAWSQFTERVLQEIKSLAPSLGPEVMAYMTKHIKQQITLLKGLAVEVRSVGNKTKQLQLPSISEDSDSEDEMSVIITCLSTFDDFVSLIESIKHEASYLIRYVEITLINFGVLDLNKEPTEIQPLRLYLMRNIISMKDCHLLTSIDYLYLEMGSLLEYTENRFHTADMYLEKFGQITADLLKKYTVNRKEAIQEKEFANIQNMDKVELEKELLPHQSPDSTAQGLSNPYSSKSPMSRYQRAEDLRKWVEDSKKTVQSSTATSDFSDAEDGSQSHSSCNQASDNYYDATSLPQENVVFGEPTAPPANENSLWSDLRNGIGVENEKLDISFQRAVYCNLVEPIDASEERRYKSDTMGSTGSFWNSNKRTTKTKTFNALTKNLKKKLSLKRSK